MTNSAKFEQYRFETVLLSLTFHKITNQRQTVHVHWNPKAEVCQWRNICVVQIVNRYQKIFWSRYIDIVIPTLKHPDYSYNILIQLAKNLTWNKNLLDAIFSCEWQQVNSCHLFNDNAYIYTYMYLFCRLTCEPKHYLFCLVDYLSKRKA